MRIADASFSGIGGEQNTNESTEGVVEHHFWVVQMRGLVSKRLLYSNITGPISVFPHSEFCASSVVRIAPNWSRFKNADLQQNKRFLDSTQTPDASDYVVAANSHFVPSV